MRVVFDIERIKGVQMMKDVNLFEWKETFMFQLITFNKAKVEALIQNFFLMNYKGKRKC